MIYSQSFPLPASGSHRVGTIGGSALVKTDAGEMQLGYMQPCRYGLIRIRPIGDSVDIFDCVANIFGYYDNSIKVIRVPGDIIVELPCSVEVVGPPGTNLLIEAWVSEAIVNRGACSSFISNQNGIIIPHWATSIDFTGNLCIFRDNSGAIVGAIDYVINTSVVGFSIPKGAATVDISGINAARTTLIFRQQ